MNNQDINKRIGIFLILSMLLVLISNFLIYKKINYNKSNISTKEDRFPASHEEPKNYIVFNRSVEFKNVAGKFEDDVWFQNGKAFYKIAQIDTTQPYCQLDSDDIHRPFTIPQGESFIASPFVDFNQYRGKDTHANSIHFLHIVFSSISTDYPPLNDIDLKCVYPVPSVDQITGRSLSIDVWHTPFRTLKRRK